MAKQKALVDAQVFKKKARLQVNAARERDGLEFEAKEKDRVIYTEEKEKERVFELERARLKASHPISEPNIRLRGAQVPHFASFRHFKCRARRSVTLPTGPVVWLF